LSGENRKRRGATGAIAVSIVAHLVALAVLGLAPGRLQPQRFESQRPVELILIPAFRPMARPVNAAPRKGATTSSVVVPHVHTPPPSPSPSLAAAPTAGPPNSASGSPIHFYDRRVAGCEREDLILMSETDRFVCQARLAGAAAPANPTTRRDAPQRTFIPDDKRGAYSVQAAADARKRAAKDKDVPMTEPVVVCSGPSANLGMGCLPDSAISRVGAH